MSTDHDIWSRQLVGGLDALPLTDAEPIPTPHYEYLPPDSAEFNADMASLARMERWIWARALWGQEGMRPEMPDDELLCNDIELGLLLTNVSIGVVNFKAIEDSIALCSWPVLVAEYDARGTAA